jgi:hypothetical protein
MSAKSESPQTLLQQAAAHPFATIAAAHVISPEAGERAINLYTGPAVLALATVNPAALLPLAALKAIELSGHIYNALHYPKGYLEQTAADAKKLKNGMTGFAWHCYKEEHLLPTYITYADGTKVTFVPSKSNFHYERAHPQPPSATGAVCIVVAGVVLGLIWMSVLNGL